METDLARGSRNELDVLVAARERILRVLGMTGRPLRWTELQSALGLLTNEARSACEWLMDQGYIAPIKLVKEATRSVEALWTLGDKGRAWAMRNGALGTAGAGVA